MSHSATARMPCAYLVMYRGRPENRAAFIAHYRDVHVPLVRRFPRIRGVDLHVAVEADAPFFLIARLQFDSREDLEAALVSPEREIARTDMQQNLHFSGDVVRQVVWTDPVPSAV